MGPNNDTILVGYDGSPDADHALQWAAETAARSGQLVWAVTVAEEPGDPDAASGWAPGDDIPARVGRVFQETGAGGTLERHVGNAESVLLQHASEATMLVLGSRGHGRTAEVVLGSVSQHLAKHAPCPVVVVRTPSTPSSSRIVVGVDGSPESIAALEFACERARVTKEPVVALHAWKAGPVQMNQRGQIPRRVAARSYAAEVELAEHVAHAHAHYPSVTVEPELVALPAGLALTEASTNASLVVTGSRGHGALLALVRGSVSDRLLHHAQCPVAVVH